MEKRKIYYVTIADLQQGIDAISLVDEPAVEMDFLCFSSQKEFKFSLDNSKHIISGVVALADTPIYRFDQEHGEYYVVFTKDLIRRMVEKFAKDDLFKSVNLQHDENQYVDGVYMFESYIVDKERGICPNEFKDIPDGSWIASYKVENEDLWNEIVNGNKLNGFSLQGYFGLKSKSEKVKEETYEEWVNRQFEEK